MNRQIRHSLLTAGIAALLGSAMLSASTYLVKANVPFTFEAGHKQAAAGHYTFRKDGSSSFFEVRSEDSGNRFVLLAPVETTSKNATPRLVFHCYGGQCALSEIWIANGSGFRTPTFDFDKKHRNLGFSPRIVSISFEPR